MAVDGKALITRYEKLKQDASTHFSVCEEMAPYIAPSRVGIRAVRSPGQRQNKDVFDSTTMMAAELMAQFVSSYAFNPSQQWGGMRPRIKDASDELQEWFESCRDRTLGDFANSMFYAEGPESLVDWVGFGTACLVTDEAPSPAYGSRLGWRGSHYEAMKTGRFVIADGPDGLVDTLMYEKDQSARQLMARFGKEKVSEKVRAAAEKEPDKAFAIVHGIYPRDASDRQYAAGAMKMPYVSCWVEKETKHVLRESGYEEFPAAVPRYHRTPGEVFGRGRGHLAFPDTWTLNTAKRMGLEDWALKQRPPVLHQHDAVIGTLRLTPGGPTSVNTHGRSIRDVIAPFDSGSRPEVSQLKEEELRKSIRQIFFIDQILALMEVNKSEMTAFEFAKKLELLFRLLGPVYGRLRKEFLERIWHIKFIQLWHAGVFEPPPAELFDTDGGYDIVFENPLERAQRSGDVESIGFAMQDMLPFLQQDPSMLDWFDRDGLAKYILKVRGVSAQAMNSDEQVQAIRDERLKSQQQEEQLAQAGQIAESAGKIAPLVTAMNGANKT